MNELTSLTKSGIKTRNEVRKHVIRIDEYEGGQFWVYGETVQDGLRIAGTASTVSSDLDGAVREAHKLLDELKASYGTQ